MTQDSVGRRDMRIAFLGASLSWRAFGVKVVMESLSAALAARGHDVRVFGIADVAWREGGEKNWLGAPARVFDTTGPKKLGLRPAYSLRSKHFARTLSTRTVSGCTGLWYLGVFGSADLPM